MKKMGSKKMGSKGGVKRMGRMRGARGMKK